VGLESSVNLIVATLDLQLVRLVRDAMRGADKAAGGAMGLIHPAPVVEPRHRHQPDPVIEPRLHHRPAPVIEPPLKMRSEDAVWSYTQCVSPMEPASAENVSRSTSPIEPPWKVLPWEDRSLPAPRVVRRIKVVVGRPDIQSKGNVIDLFI
jgi:hypothetical protein